jgi:hypothetical protein
MEKSFQLDQRENALLGQVEQARTQALAAIGALSLDMETAKKNLDMVAEQQRYHIRQALLTRNIERYENARVQNGSLIVLMPESDPPAMSNLEGMKIVDRPNGMTATVKE